MREVDQKLHTFDKTLGFPTIIIPYLHVITENSSISNLQYKHFLLYQINNTEAIIIHIQSTCTM